MRSRAGQRVPVWLQAIVVALGAAAMVIAADAVARISTAIAL